MRKTYHVRSGVVLCNIDQHYLLFADKSARNYCSYVIEINETAAYCWNKLERGISLDELLGFLKKDYNISDITEVKKDIQEMIEQLKCMNYLIEE